MSVATTKKLSQLQSWFLRLCFQVGPGAPSISLTWDTAVLDMGLRVKKEKLMLIIHVRSLEKTTLARQIYEEQKLQGWPGLALETQAICQDLEIEDCNITRLSKEQYSKEVHIACHIRNEQIMRDQATGSCMKLTAKKNI